MHNTHYTMYTYNVLIGSTELNCSYQCQISGTNWILDDFFYKTRKLVASPVLCCTRLQPAGSFKGKQKKKIEY